MLSVLPVHSIEYTLSKVASFYFIVHPRSTFGRVTLQDVTLQDVTIDLCLLLRFLLIFVNIKTAEHYVDGYTTVISSLIA